MGTLYRVFKSVCAVETKHIRTFALNHARVLEMMLSALLLCAFQHL
jgi:hypothetical protein